MAATVLKGMSEKFSPTPGILALALRDALSRKRSWSGKGAIREYRQKNRSYYLCELVKKQVGVRDGSIGYHLRPSDVVVPAICPVFGTPLRDPVLVRIDPTKDWERDNVRVVSKRAKLLIDQKRALAHPRPIDVPELAPFFHASPDPTLSQATIERVREAFKKRGPQAFLWATDSTSRTTLQSFLNGEIGLDLLSWSVLGDFNTRAEAAFERLSIRTVSDLLLCNVRTLLASRNFGERTLRQINAVLKPYGVELV